MNLAFSLLGSLPAEELSPEEIQVLAASGAQGVDFLLEISSSQASSLTPMNSSIFLVFLIFSNPYNSWPKPGTEDNPGPAPGFALSTRTQLIV